MFLRATFYSVVKKWFDYELAWPVHGQLGSQENPTCLLNSFNTCVSRGEQNFVVVLENFCGIILALAWEFVWIEKNIKN